MDNNQNEKHDEKEKIKQNGVKNDVGNAKQETITSEQKKENERYATVVKELEQAIFSIKFYPVAVKDEAKDNAKEKIKEIYEKENESIKQLVLYMIHEALSQTSELKIMHNFENFKRKNPAVEPGQLRIQVYRAIFNYNFSIEGLAELIYLLGELGNDSASKVLTYHFSFLCSIESESARILRNAIVKTLGECESIYALKSLLEYAKNTDDERLVHRIAAALTEWSEKLETLKISRKEKEQLRRELDKVFMLELGDSHYG